MDKTSLKISIPLLNRLYKKKEKPDNKKNGTRESSVSINFGLLIGIFILSGVSAIALASSDYVPEPTIKEIIREIGVTLIIASSVGIMIDVLMKLRIKDRQKQEEESIQDSIIKALITRAEEWIDEKREFPINKTLLNKIIKLSLREWFQKEDYKKIGLTNEEVSDTFEEERLAKLRGIAIKDHMWTFTCLDQSNHPNFKKSVTIKIHSKMNVVNTARNDESSEIRYYNGNGELEYFSVEVPDEISDYDGDKILNYVMNPTLHTQKEGEKRNKHIINYIKLNVTEEIDLIKRESISQRKDRVKNMNNGVCNENEAYLFYYLESNIKSNELGNFRFVLFFPKPFKPDESLDIIYERTFVFLDIDFFLITTKTLTNNLEVRLENFTKFKTNMFNRLVGRGKRIQLDDPFTHKISGMIFAHSDVLVTWRPNNL